MKNYEGLFNHERLIKKYSEDNISPRIYLYPEIMNCMIWYDDNIIMIHGWDGLEPHFHLYKGFSTNEFPNENQIYRGSAISLIYPKYYIHDNNHKEILSDYDIESLNTFLRNPHVKNPKFTNWHALVSAWNRENFNGIQIPDDYPIPEYHYDMGIIVE